MFNWAEAKPNFVTITPDGFVECGIEEPNTLVYLSVEIPIREFNKIAKYAYKQTDDSKDPLIDGLVAVGWFVDDCPKYITEVSFWQRADKPRPKESTTIVEVMRG